MTRAIYPGSFDPFTNGHLDIIKRSAKIFDAVIIAVGENPAKKTLFTREERIKMIKEVLKDIKNVEVDGFDSLLVDYAKKKKATVVIRGIRTISDFEYEYQMALTNKALAKDIETLFMLTAKEYAFVSAKLVKEAVSLGGDISGFVPNFVASQIKQKYKEP